MTKSAGDYRCALSRADFQRQSDVYRLAKMGEKASRRLWDEFARESPDSARLVVGYVADERVKDQEANRHLDLVLSKGEKAKVSKTGKPSLSKAEKKTAKEIRKARDYRPSPDQLFTWQVSQWLNSDNPQEREAARQVLSSRQVPA